MRLIAILCCFACVGAVTVKVGSTNVVGTTNPSLKQDTFRGIPFAQPPVGSLRLQPPVAKYTLPSGTFNASAFGPACIQLPSADAVASAASMSEDCLTLNIIRPAGLSAKSALPVLVWIYGGGFSEGAGSIYDGSPVVSQSVNRGTPVIYVNFNYRLGPLGFPLGAEAGARGALNLGLHDQRIALTWIQHNIAAFGGDPTKVTVWGLSAGAISIAIHMLDPTFGSLARGAILQSGSAGTAAPGPANAQNAAWSSFIAAFPQCRSSAASNSSFACLQQAKLSTTDFVNALTALQSITSTGISGLISVHGTGFMFAPMLDGASGFLPSLPNAILQSGKYAKIPFITGDVLDEGTYFVAGTSARYVNQAAVTSALSTAYSPFPQSSAAAASVNATVQSLVNLYSTDPSLGSPYNTGSQTFLLPPLYKQLAAIAGDITFHAARRALQQASISNGIPSFGYIFAEPQPEAPTMLGVTHGQDQPYPYSLCQGLSSTCPALTMAINDYFLSFASSLTPNDAHGVTKRLSWPAYTKSNPQLLQIGGLTPATVIPDTYRAQQIAFIQKNAAVFHF